MFLCRKDMHLNITNAVTDWDGSGLKSGGSHLIGWNSTGFNHHYTVGPLSTYILYSVVGTNHGV